MGSPAYSKVKGRVWELLVNEYLQHNGFPDTERRGSQGRYDRGDHSGVPLLCIEDKHERTYRFGEWVREAEREAENAKVPYAVVFVRQNGRPYAGHGFAVMSITGFVAMYHDYMEKVDRVRELERRYEPAS